MLVNPLAEPKYEPGSYAFSLKLSLGLGIIAMVHRIVRYHGGFKVDLTKSIPLITWKFGLSPQLTGRESIRAAACFILEESRAEMGWRIRCMKLCLLLSLTPPSRRYGVAVQERGGQRVGPGHGLRSEAT